MNQSQVNAFVPESFFTEGKDRQPCRLFREDLALISPASNNQIIASRGIRLHAGEALSLSEKDALFLKSALRFFSALPFGSSPRILLQANDRVLILFTELLHSCGLLVALMPHEDAGLVSSTLSYLLRDGDLLSPTLSEIPRGNGSIEDCYAMLSEQIAQCTRILLPESTADFRLHAAHVASFSGCLANVTDLPVGNFPISSTDMQRWSAFLLGLFLILRGDSATPTRLDLARADTRAFYLCLEHKPEAKRKTSLESKLKMLLYLPCFSDICLAHTERGLTFEFKLSRRHGGLLHADPFGADTIAITLEIRFA